MSSRDQPTSDHMIRKFEEQHLADMEHIHSTHQQEVSVMKQQIDNLQQQVCVVDVYRCVGVLAILGGCLDALGPNTGCRQGSIPDNDTSIKHSFLLWLKRCLPFTLYVWQVI